ncbi:glycosyltransferase family 4 protein [Stieleria sp. JC731]|uniref:glycosyltransferase family 4 protein n=1 Tax=Pirellulaceae TaxID=2691357 RepID=UPI001E3A3287|nr:glycosyltransferase family 4 protein [Stieleria sp. JC731]MCC9604077.1 glycosyltransferase family 4 protein [Stieleria sp. JC731]
MSVDSVLSNSGLSDCEQMRANDPAAELASSQWATAPLPARVVFLTHYIPLYQVRVLEEIARQVRDFHVLISTPIEPNRQFELDWGNLNVTVQKTLTVRRRWKHRSNKTSVSKDALPTEKVGGFSDPLYVHVPYDTAAQLSRLNPDVVMSLELGARSLGAVRYCKRHQQCKSILCTYMSEHTEQHRGNLRAMLRRYLVRNADAITFNGPSCKRYLTSIGADERSLYQLAYAADDRSSYRGSVCRKESEVRSRLLFVGQLSDRKGVVPMLSQLAGYCSNHPSRSIEIRIAGDGPNRSAIESFPCPSNLSITMLGNLAADKLATEMSLAGATIAPTLADEWLLVVNEALQAGLPVIGSVYAQAVTTLVRDGFNGWQYDPCQDAPSGTNSLSYKLDQYFAISDQSMADMRANCRQSVAERSPRWAAAGAVKAIASLTGDRSASDPVR